MIITYECRKCGKRMTADRIGGNSREECYEELLEIGRSVLFPHFEEHYPTGDRGFIVVITWPEVDFDMDRYLWLHNNFHVSLLCNLVISRRSTGEIDFLD